MTWGFLSAAHIISLFCAVGIIAGLYFLLKNRSDKTKIAVLFILSFSGIAAIIYNLLAWNSPLEYLPFHLCSLSGMILPIAVITKSKIMNNLLLLWSFGSLFALLINVAVADAELFSWVFVFFYFPHVLEVGIPILMFLLRLVKKDIKCVVPTILITVCSYTVIHFINLLINNYTVANNIVDYASNVINVNYMYSIRPENALLELFYSIIPHQYWYMYLSFVLAAVYLGFVYLNDIINLIRKRSKDKK